LTYKDDLTGSDMDNERELRLAVLIDADNMSAASVKGMMEEIAKYGTPTFKRIYGDWTKPNLQPWKEVLNAHAITPFQQFSYTVGKNATDSAMIIDAMDILHAGHVDGFCLVSSDSDFTRLATRLREAGKKVFGIGQKKTPAAFIAACDKFIYVEILGTKNGSGSTKKASTLMSKSSTPANKASAPAKKLRAQKAPSSVEAPMKNLEPTASPLLQTMDEQTIRLMTSSISDIADDSGWAALSHVGGLIAKKQPDFDSRNYGFSKLTALMKSMPGYFEIAERPSPSNPDVTHVCVRAKSPKID
jgi:uncharacterized LabA/DUF88 family protein